MTCELDGCDNQTKLLESYCCDSHRQAGWRHAIEVTEAMRNGEEFPEPPTAEEVDRIAAEASKWTPERMKARLEVFREAYTLE